MSNYSDDDEIKQLFVDESLEALQRVEQLLLEAEEGHPRGNMLDTMFRDMHTIKGTSALLGYEKTASLAHAAEDLMSRLRDKSIIARKDHFAHMVQVVDALRQLVEHTRDKNSEGTFDFSSLIDSLRRDLELGNDAPPQLAPTPVAAPAPAAPTPAAPPVFEPVAQAAPAPTPAAPAPDAPAAKDDHHGGGEADGTVRVNVAVLDKLMNLMGELVLARNQMVQLVRAVHDPQAQAAGQRLSIVTSDLQEQIMKTRMQPVARVFEKIPRLARDLSQQTGKRVAVDLEGTATELDKALVEAIRDPIMHIIRNAIDHGIELPAVRVARGKPASGRLVVRAAHEGSTVTIEVRDDGGGIDPTIVKRVAVSRGVITQAEADRMGEREATELVFRPGFSTAEKVTNLSGRGVGMDVVRTHVERAGGLVELESHLGKGTTIRMKMPLTLAIIPALLVRDGAQRFAIPQANLLELVYLDDEQVKKEIEHIRGAPIYRLRGEILPLVKLSPLLRHEGTAQSGVNIVVVAIGARRYGLVVEAIQDTEEIVIKPLHSMIKKLPCYAGATVLGDGGVALILDVAGIASMAGIELKGGHDLATVSAGLASELTTQSMLIFTAGDNARCAVPVSMLARLEQVDAKAIEFVAGSEVLQYRGELMPIIRPESALPIGSAPPSENGVQQLLVFNFGRPVGLAVNAILDTFDVETTHPSDVPLTLAKTVVFSRTTLVVDVFALVRQLAPGCVSSGSSSATVRRPRVLLADEVDAMRASLAGFLRASGVDVVETTIDSVVRDLRNAAERQFDAVVAGIGRRDISNEVKQEQPGLPLVCVSNDTASGASIKRAERELVLEALVNAGIFTKAEARAS